MLRDREIIWCVCVCERERERERETLWLTLIVSYKISYQNKLHTHIYTQFRVSIEFDFCQPAV